MEARRAHRGEPPFFTNNLGAHSVFVQQQPPHAWVSWSRKSPGRQTRRCWALGCPHDHPGISIVLSKSQHCATFGTPAGAKFRETSRLVGSTEASKCYLEPNRPSRLDVGRRERDESRIVTSAWTVTQGHCEHGFPLFMRRCKLTSQPRTPVKKSSNGVLLPRLFSETSPSARTSKGFLIVGQRVTSSRRQLKRTKSSRPLVSAVIKPAVASVHTCAAAWQHEPAF